MKTIIQSKDQRQAAIIAGSAIITMTIAATIANDFTIGGLIIDNNPSATLKNILASKTIFSIGVLSWLVILIADVFAAWGLYVFLKPVSKTLSLLTAWFRLSYVAMLAVSIFNFVYVHIIIHQPELSAVDPTGQLSERVMFYINSFDAMFSFSLIVFSIHILLLGYLSLKSEYIPKIFGIVLFIAFVGYLIVNTAKLLFPEHSEVILTLEYIFLLPMLGEVALGIWLLILGLRKKNNHV